jgi:hypothetical protein
MIRQITPDDIPALLDIAHESYDYKFDDAAMTEWGLRAIQLPNVLALRDDDAFGLCQVTGTHWNPAEIHGCMVYFAMRKSAAWQGCKILRTMRDYSIAMGAIDFQFGEATNMRMDVFAKRIGAVPNRPTYVYRPGAR